MEVASCGARLPSDFCYLMAVLMLQAVLETRATTDTDSAMVRTGAWSNVLVRRALLWQDGPGREALDGGVRDYAHLPQT